MRVQLPLLSAFLLIAISQGSPAQTSPAFSLKAGAAKIDVTPAEGELPKTYHGHEDRRYEGILDRLYARAIVVDNGTTSAALITLDAGSIPDELWQTVSRRVEAGLGIPAKNVLLTATHSHSAPADPDPGAVLALAQKVFESVQAAKAKLQPARMAYGTGVSYINVNRDIIDAKTRRWRQGPNYEGPSDKTVAVVKFETLTGEPIAVYYNYAMHAVTVGVTDLVSADAPGAASGYIEDSFDDKIVALWSTGAAGDQSPIYYRQTYDLREIRIKEYAKRGEDISNAMPPGGTGLNKQDPTVPS